MVAPGSILTGESSLSRAPEWVQIMCPSERPARLVGSRSVCRSTPLPAVRTRKGSVQRSRPAAKRRKGGDTDERATGLVGSRLHRDLAKVRRSSSLEL
jgi:hypothetical protein